MRLSLGTSLFEDYFGKFMALWPHFNKVSFVLFLCLFNSWFMTNMRPGRRVTDACRRFFKLERSETISNSCVYPYLNRRTAETVIQLFYNSGIIVPNFSFSKPFESLQSLDTHFILLNELDWNGRIACP